MTNKATKQQRQGKPDKPPVSRGTPWEVVGRATSRKVAARPEDALQAACSAESAVSNG